MKIDKALEDIKATSCETVAIATVEHYIKWLETMIRMGYAKEYSGVEPDKLREEFDER